MNYTSKSELLLKYQKTKAKLTEFEVPKDAYPQFIHNSHDLSFSSVYALSCYAESIIKNDYELQSQLKPLLYKIAQYYDSAYKSNDRINRKLDFLITGAVAYFFQNDFGSAKALLLRIEPNIPISIHAPFDLLICCMRFLLFSKQINKQIKEENAETKELNILLSLYSYFSSGQDAEHIFSLLIEYREYIYSYSNSLDAFYIDLLYAIILVAVEKSAWELLPRYSGIATNIWKSYLEKKDGIKILWQSQELLCSFGVLQGNDAIIQLPTGVGKTKSIELIIRSAQLSKRATNVVIVAPLRALCNEISYDLQYAFRKDNIEINQFSEVLEDDYSLVLSDTDSMCVSVCTPEKLSYIIHHQTDFCDNLDLIILDEAHMFDDGIRGVNYEFLVSTIREQLKESQQLVLLSAVMKNAGDITQWLFGGNGVTVSDANIITTPKAVGFYNSNEIAYYSGDPLESDFFVHRSINRKQLRLLGKERKPRFFPEQNDYRDIALYYGILLCKNGGVAVYVEKTKSVKKTINRILDIYKRGYDIKNLVENVRITELQKIQNLIIQYYGKDHEYTNACLLGILPHHGRLPNGIKLAVENTLREGNARFVVCTSSLAQGVNIPIKYLLLSDISQRYDGMNIRSFQNLIGRIARAGMYTEGSIIVTNPDLYNNRFDIKHGGKYKWENCCNMFSKSKEEPCSSSILSLVKKIRINYTSTMDSDAIINFLIQHYNDDNCFTSLYEYIISYANEKQMKPDEQRIKDQVFVCQQVLEAIENHLCFIYGTESLSYDDIIDGISNKICEQSLAYYFADDSQRTMLLSIFHVIEEKVRSLSSEQQKRYGISLIDINCGKIVDEWIARINLYEQPYSEEELLHHIVDLFNTLNNDYIDETRFTICQEWLKGTMPIEIATLTNMDIDKVMDFCHQTLSYNLSFLVGNIIDLLSDGDTDNIDTLILLQKKIKYGAPNKTTIAICEFLFWDRYIAMNIAEIIGMDDLQSSDLDEYLIYNIETIRNFLENLPRCFIERFESAISQHNEM